MGHVRQVGVGVEGWELVIAFWLQVVWLSHLTNASIAALGDFFCGVETATKIIGILP